MRLVLLLVLVACAAFAEAPSPGGGPAPEPPTLPEVVDPGAAKLEASPSGPDAPKIDPSLPGATTKQEPAEDLDFGWMLLRTVAVLGLVIMIAWFTLNFGLRKLMGLKPVVPGASVVQVLERVPLDSKHNMYVVKAAGEYLL